MSDQMCRAPGCVVAVSSRLWLCRRHWRELRDTPDELRATRDELIAAWMREDDERRARMMLAGKQRLELSRKRRR